MRFAEAITQTHGATIIEKLSSGPEISSLGDLDRRRLVLEATLSRLEDIRDALVTVGDSKAISEAIYQSNNRRLVEALLDLVSLEGIYPCLQPGVGVPVERRVKSILQAGATVNIYNDRHSVPNISHSVLAHIVRRLCDLAAKEPNEFASIVQQRVLVDIVAAYAQDVYGPQNTSSPDAASVSDFEMFIAR